MIIKLNLKNVNNFEIVLKEYPDILNDIIVSKYIFVKDSIIL